jgi:hypothetical protein
MQEMRDEKYKLKYELSHTQERMSELDRIGMEKSEEA